MNIEKGYTELFSLAYYSSIYIIRNENKLCVIKIQKQEKYVLIAKLHL